MVPESIAGEKDSLFSQTKVPSNVSDMLRKQLDDNYRGIKSVLSSAIPPGDYAQMPMRSANDLRPHVLGLWGESGLVAETLAEIFGILPKPP